MFLRQSRPSRRLGMENQSRRSLLLWEVRKILDSVLCLIFTRVHFVGSSFQEETNKVLTDGNCGIESNIGKPKISQMKWKSSESIQPKVSAKRQNKKTLPTSIRETLPLPVIGIISRILKTIRAPVRETILQPVRENGQLLGQDTAPKPVLFQFFIVFYEALRKNRLIVILNFCIFPLWNGFFGQNRNLLIAFCDCFWRFDPIIWDNIERINHGSLI